MLGRGLIAVGARRRREVSPTPDGRYLVVDGRRWRAEDPELPDELAEELRSALGRARSAVRTAQGEDRTRMRERVQLAKEGLGERGEPWWELTLQERRERALDRLRCIDDAEAAGRNGD